METLFEHKPLWRPLSYRMSILDLRLLNPVGQFSPKDLSPITRILWKVSNTNADNMPDFKLRALDPFHKGTNYLGVSLHR